MRWFFFLNHPLKIYRDDSWEKIWDVKKKHHPLKSRRDMGGSFTAVSEWFRGATLNWILIFLWMMVWDGMSARRFVWHILDDSIWELTGNFPYLFHTKTLRIHLSQRAACLFSLPPWGKKNWTWMIAYGPVKKAGVLKPSVIGFINFGIISDICWWTESGQSFDTSNTCWAFFSKLKTAHTWCCPIQNSVFRSIWFANPASQEIGSAETRDIGDASIHEVPKATGPKSGGKDLYLGDDLRKSQEGFWGEVNGEVNEDRM